MRNSLFKVFALSVLFTPSAFANFNAIFNGAPVSAGGQSWRSTVALTFNGFACTGVFIARDTIVTAAHCDITNEAELGAELRNGNSLSAINLTFQPGEFLAYKNPEYVPINNPTPGLNDVQVVILKKQALPPEFSPVSLLPLSAGNLTDAGNAITIVGAGKTETGDFSKRFMFATGTVTDYENDTVMVVDLGPQGICGGDSGGPVFTKNGGALYLSAIINARANDVSKDCGRTLLAARLVPSMVNWIQKTTQEARLAF